MRVATTERAPQDLAVHIDIKAPTRTTLRIDSEEMKLEETRATLGRGRGPVKDKTTRYPRMDLATPNQLQPRSNYCTVPDPPPY